MTTIYYLGWNGGKRAVKLADGTVFEDGAAVAMVDGRDHLFARGTYFIDRAAAEAALPAASTVKTETIYIAKPGPRGQITTAPYEAEIDADGVAHYGPSPEYRILVAPAGSFGRTADEALQIYTAAHPRPEPLYAIPTLPEGGVLATDRVPVTVSSGRIRYEHSVTIDDKPTAARIAAGLCRLLLLPLGLFKRNRRGFYTGLAGAHIGDLIWVKEPFTLYTPRRHGGEGFITTAADEAATANSMRRTNASWQSFDWNADYKEATRAASAMARYQSRMTLIVIRVRTGKHAIPLSMVSDADARLAGFSGDRPADQLMDATRATHDERAFGVNPYLVLIEFAAYRANIEDALAYLKPHTPTDDEKSGWVGPPPAQVRNLFPHEMRE